MLNDDKSLYEDYKLASGHARLCVRLPGSLDRSLERASAVSQGSGACIHMPCGDS